ncbi:MAG: acyl-CoA dehydrogenase family protein, partial [Pseudomonadota bacterium]
EAIQLHGGMGTTTELDIAHYHTRIRVLAESSGAADLQLTRFAQSPARGAGALDTVTDTGAAA